MKPIETIIAKYLADYPALKPLHGGRCRQGIADQKWPVPYQTVFLISAPAEMRRLKIPAVRLQINSFAKAYALAQEMADTTFAALDGLSGTVQGVKIEQCIAGDISEDYEPATELYNASLDAILIYRSDI